MKQVPNTLDVHVFSSKQAYNPMWDLQKQWVSEIDQGLRSPSLLLLEHKHVITLGRGSENDHLLLSPNACKEAGIDLVEIDRGGDITYHGPGQLVGYPLLPLHGLQNDTHRYLRTLEQALLDVLREFGIDGGRKPPYTGVWVDNEKVAAIGVKFNRGKQTRQIITSHGFALNVTTELSMFDHIIPCGIRDYGVTSMQRILGQKLNMRDVMEHSLDYIREYFQFERVRVQYYDHELKKESSTSAYKTR